MKGFANVGDVLAGKYRVDKILGLGGMGMVVAATHLELDQQVALKFMLPAALESPEASARFLREARAAGRLTSEHICRVTDVGRFESGAPYIVMEYLEGYDLGTMLKRRGPLRVGPAVDYILQACEGLAEAHAHGIVHRDLKPDNLYLSARADGGHIIKVLDFGISKATVTGIATRTGDILGSPAYMAPEQMRSTKDVDARADVWSLGAVMYQLLTGRLPFTGDSLPTLCLSVLNDDPVPPQEVRDDLPEGLAAVILRCLGKEPEARYADVGELAAALGPFATPAGFGSVTRVQSALRGRQAPPDPSQTMPHGFDAQDGQGAAAPGAVPPTLVGPEHMLGPGSDLFIPRMPPARSAMGVTTGASTLAEGMLGGAMADDMAEPVGLSTVSAGAGESIVMTKVISRRSRRGRAYLIVGLCGAIAMVCALIVIVASSGGGVQVAEPGAAPPPQVVAPTADPTPRPQVTPIDDPAAGSAAQSGAGAPDKDPAGQEPDQDPTAQDPVAQGSGKAAVDPKGAGARPDHGARPRPWRGKRTGKGGKGAPKAGGSGSGSGSAGQPPEDAPPVGDGSDDDDDQWSRMHHDHDQPKENTP